MARKMWTIEDMKMLAASKSGRCLSDKYINGQTKLHWECKNKHHWWASSNNIRQMNTWCPECSGYKKLTIEEMQEIARSRGGKCLSEEYTNSRTKLLWECSKGHVWWTTPHEIKTHNTWCPECYNKNKLSIEEIHILAASKGGKCLSSEYINGSTKLQWECSKGHRWWAIPYSIKNANTWCGECAGRGSKKGTIEEMQELAKAKGGKCLSVIYRGAAVKLEWECAKGHIWSAKPNVIKNGNTWCRKCFTLSRSLTIGEMQQLAKVRGGECLSEKYRGIMKKLQWKCDKGHKWSAAPSRIKYQNYWCPQCAKLRKRKK
jgi:hypothetical protein